MPDSEESSDDDDDDNDDNDDDHDDGDNDDDEGRGPSGAGASIALQIQAAQKMLALAALGQSQEKQRTQQEIDVEINQNVQNWAAYLRNSGTEQGKQTAHFLLHASREQQIECIQRLLQTEQQMPALAAQEEQRTQQAIDAEFNQRVQTWVDYLRNVATEQSNASANYLLHANREEQVQYMQRLASNQQPSASAESSKGSSSKGKEKAHRKR